MSTPRPQSVIVSSGPCLAAVMAAVMAANLQQLAMQAHGLHIAPPPATTPPSRLHELMQRQAPVQPLIRRQA